jgi:hypothetical protein
MEVEHVLRGEFAEGDTRARRISEVICRPTAESKRAVKVIYRSILILG